MRSTHQISLVEHIQEKCNNVSSIGLLMVHTIHGCSFNLDTIRNVQVKELFESRNMSESMVQLYGEGISRSFEMGSSYSRGQDSTLSIGQTCSDIDKSFIFPGPFISQAGGNFTQNFNHEVVGLIPMGGVYGKGDGNVLSTFQPFEKGVENFVLMDQSFQKADCNIFSMSPSYNKGQENFMSLLSCEKVSDDLFMVESSHQNENFNVLLGGQSPYKKAGDMAFMVSSQDRADQNNDQISHKDRIKTISFGDYQKEATMVSSARGINSYESFTHDPATSKGPLHMEAEENMSFIFRNHAYSNPRVDTCSCPKVKIQRQLRRVIQTHFLQM